MNSSNQFSKIQKSIDVIKHRIAKVREKHGILKHLGRKDYNTNLLITQVRKKLTINLSDEEKTKCLLFYFHMTKLYKKKKIILREKLSWV